MIKEAVNKLKKSGISLGLRKIMDVGASKAVAVTSFVKHLSLEEGKDAIVEMYLIKDEDGKVYLLVEPVGKVWNDGSGRVIEPLED